MDIKNEIPEWLWADEYGDTLVLRLLEPIDMAWHEENERKKEKKKKKAKRAKVSADEKVKRDEDRLTEARQATVQRRASQGSQGSQGLPAKRPAASVGFCMLSICHALGFTLVIFLFIHNEG